MEYKEIKSRPKTELLKILREQRELLREMRFKVANRGLKNVRDIKKTKLAIARILTALKSSK